MRLQQTEFTLGSQFNEDGTTRLEVALLALKGKTRLELRLLDWSEGIGWYIQKRIQLDPLQIGALRAMLGRGAGQVKPSTRRLAMTHTINRSAGVNLQELHVSLCPWGLREETAA